MTLPSASLYPEDPNKQAKSSGKKSCQACGLTFSIGDFYRDNSRKDGRSSKCKVCSDIRRETIRKNNPEKEREMRRRWVRNNADKNEANRKLWYEKNRDIQSLKKKEKLRLEDPEKKITRHRASRFRILGIAEDWYDRTLAEQGGGCAMCGTKNPGGNGKRFHIDHDHRCCNKQFTSCDKCRRGLLCNRCNLNLGIIEGEIWRKQAMAYLNKWRKDGKKYDEDQGTLFDF